MADLDKSDRYLKRSESVRAIAHGLKIFIKIFAAALAAYFGYLAISDAPIDKITSVFTPSGINQAGLFILFFCWWVGAQDDVTILDLGYSHDRGTGLELRIIGTISGFCLFFFLLFYFSERQIIFQIIVLIVLLFNILGWRDVIRRSIPMIEETQNVSIQKKDEIVFLKCLVAIGYIDGRWQRLRFSFMAILAIIQISISIVIYYSMIPKDYYGIKFGSVQLGQILEYTPGVVFILYVIVSEIWMSLYRAKAFADFHLLDFVGLRFNVNPKKQFPMEKNYFKPMFSFEKDVYRGYNGTIDVPFL